MTRTAAVIAVLVAAPLAAAQSLTFSKGQNISPAYEGWEQAADGTKYFLFGHDRRHSLNETDQARSRGSEKILQPQLSKPKSARFRDSLAN